MAGVNRLASNANKVKVGDNGSEMELSLTNIENAQVIGVEYVRLSNRDWTEYVDVPEHNVTNGVLSIQFPDVPNGSYYLEVKDTDGRIYPADSPVEVEFVKSTEGAKQEIFIDYREEILGEIPTMVRNYVNANQEMLRGPRGHRGYPFTFEDFTQAQLDDLKAEVDDSALQDAVNEVNQVRDAYLDEDGPYIHDEAAGTHYRYSFKIIDGHLNIVTEEA